VANVVVATAVAAVNTQTLHVLVVLSLQYHMGMERPNTIVEYKWQLYQ